MKSVACAIIWRSFYLGFRTIHAHVVQLSQSSCTAVIAALSPCNVQPAGPDVGVTRSAGVHGVRGVLADKSLTRQIFFRYTAFVARPITQQSELRYRVQHLHSKSPRKRAFALLAVPSPYLVSAVEVLAAAIDLGACYWVDGFQLVQQIPWASLFLLG